MAEQEFTGSRLFLNIPAIVAHDKVLLKKAPKAILLFGEIYSMLNVTGKFYMSNNTHAERLDCSRQSIINYINLLKKQGKSVGRLQTEIMLVGRDGMGIVR